MNDRDKKIYRTLEEWKELPVTSLEIERRWFIEDAIWTACLSKRDASPESMVGDGNQDERPHIPGTLVHISRKS